MLHCKYCVITKGLHGSEFIILLGAHHHEIRLIEQGEVLTNIATIDP